VRLRPPVRTRGNARYQRSQQRPLSCHVRVAMSPSSSLPGPVMVPPHGFSYSFNSSPAARPSQRGGPFHPGPWRAEDVDHGPGSTSAPAAEEMEERTVGHGTTEHGRRRSAARRLQAMVWHGGAGGRAAVAPEDCGTGYAGDTLTHGGWECRTRSPTCSCTPSYAFTARLRPNHYPLRSGTVQTGVRSSPALLDVHASVAKMASNLIQASASSGLQITGNFPWAPTPVQMAAF
jgi:hypothetical protein